MSAALLWMVLAVEPAPASTVALIDVRARLVRRLERELGDGIAVEVRHTRSTTCATPCDRDDDQSLIASHGVPSTTRFVVIERRYADKRRVVALYDRQRLERPLAMHFRGHDVETEVARRIAMYTHDLRMAEAVVASGEPSHTTPTVLMEGPMELCETHVCLAVYVPEMSNFRDCRFEDVVLPPPLAPGRCRVAPGTDVPWFWLLVVLAGRIHARRRQTLDRVADALPADVAARLRDAIDPSSSGAPPEDDPLLLPP
jgi:hypothetical protein